MDFENKVVELSQAPYPDGRRRIVVALHEIYPNEGLWNKNGITWLEPYVSENAPTIVGMPLCVRYLDEENGIPYDHGLSDVDGNMPVFEDSHVVGACDSWEIREIEMDGTAHKVLCASGVLYQQREPEFVEWLSRRMQNGETVYSSIEIVARRGAEQVKYRDGRKGQGRIPTEYVYSGHAFLTVKPADGTAVVLEMNEEKGQEEETLDEKTMNALIEQMEAKIRGVLEKNEAGETALKEMQGKLDEANQRIKELEDELMKKNGEIDACKTQQEQAEAAMTEKDTELQAVITSLNEAKGTMQIKEMCEQIATFSEAQQGYAKEEIEKFKADPLGCGIEVNQIVEKIKACSYDAYQKGVVETNAFKVDDIFGSVETDTKGEDDFSLDNLYE